MNTEKKLEKIRNGQPLTTREQILLVALLSLPAILSQLTTVVMQYADAAMVGRLGAEGTAAIGLRGVWIAMCTDLCTRGALFLIRLARSFRAPAGKSST